MNKSSLWLLLLGFALGVVTTTRRCNTSSSGGEPLPITTHVEIVYDTINIINPPPITIEPIVIEPIEVTNNDMNPIELEPLSIYTFTDTISGIWSAKIVGRDVELRELTLHNRIEYCTQNIYRPPVWEVVAQTHIWGTMPYVGLNVVHNIGRIHLSGFLGFNPHVGGRVVLGGTLGVVIWRK